MAHGLTAPLGTVIKYKGVEFVVTARGVISTITGDESSEVITEGRYHVIRKPFGLE